ncbi:UDP-2,3-diacylglucosamine diphosphatase [Halioglobus sp. HI00S01]|uniref:UDP-2,3-diacylglucosamine diphosphatase n=1 Tax=Halioglobus sp. HI00S01 TaxID=1822214 RepID=UPI0007C2C0DF|nr:UDP-2,3-diacylglucosamine diphosphatase [Halioglobus sp. HI00S01]KZX60171.1 UDP-2,3-diacylglucosamine diphosphatase [Halioglobus sp. HI00S01]
MQRTLFISDLHLDPARPDVIRALAAFLDHNTDCDALYILGDLFEVWVGDDDDAPLVAEMRDRFQAFTKAGPSLYFIHGNRDFLLGDDFATACGGQLLPDPTLIELYGTPTLLMHGDSLCTLDEEYMQFRAMARSPAWRDEILSKPLDERRAIAAHIRAASSEGNSNKAEDIMDVTPIEVDKIMVEASVSRLIHGHTHRPARHQVANGERIVLGDWEASGWYIDARSDSIELIDFDINQ